VTAEYGRILRSVGHFVTSVLDSEYPGANHQTPNKYAGHNQKHVRSVATGLLVPHNVVRGTIGDIHVRAVTRDQAAGAALRTLLTANPELARAERHASQAYLLLWANVARAPRMDRTTGALCMVAADVDTQGSRPNIWPRYIGRLLSQTETDEKRERGLFDLAGSV
jgi:hypothetical protein